MLGIHEYARIGGIVYLDALNDGTDDYTDYDAPSSKLPKAMQEGRSLSPTDLKSFSAYRDWRKKTQGILIPEAELRNDFAENPDGRVGSRTTPEYVFDGMATGDHKHDYSQIRSPVLAFVVYDTPDGTSQGQARKYHVTDAAERTIVDAVYGLYIGMVRIRIDRINHAAGGARDLTDLLTFKKRRRKSPCLCKRLFSIVKKKSKSISHAERSAQVYLPRRVP